MAVMVALVRPRAHQTSILTHPFQGVLLVVISVRELSGPSKSLGGGPLDVGNVRIRKSPDGLAGESGIAVDGLAG